MATKQGVRGEVKDTLFAAMFVVAEPNEETPRSVSPGCSTCSTATFSRCRECDRETCGNCLDTVRHTQQWHRSAA
jgi:hypothetical protein